MRAGGTIAMRIYVDNDSNQRTANEQYYAACDFIGQVMDDLTDELGSGTTIDFGWASIVMEEPIIRTELATRTAVEDVWTCKYILDHGVDA